MKPETSNLAFYKDFALLIVPILFGLIVFFLKRLLSDIDSKLTSASKKTENFSNQMDELKNNFDQKIDGIKNTLDREINKLINYSRLNEKALTDFQREIMQEKQNLRQEIKNVEWTISDAIAFMKGVQFQMNNVEMRFSTFKAELEGSTLTLKEIKAKVHWLDKQYVRIVNNYKDIKDAMEKAKEILKVHNKEISILKIKTKGK